MNTRSIGSEAKSSSREHRRRHVPKYPEERRVRFAMQSDEDGEEAREQGSATKGASQNSRR